MTKHCTVFSQTLYKLLVHSDVLNHSNSKVLLGLRIQGDNCGAIN